MLNTSKKMKDDPFTFDPFSFPVEEEDEKENEIFDPTDIAANPSVRKMVLFFIIDTSYSMYGCKISTVNAALDEVVMQLKEKEGKFQTAHVEVMVMEFNSEANWLTKDPIYIQDYQYEPIQEVKGATNYGAVYAKMEKALSRSTVLKDRSDYAPCIVFISDGEPNYPFAAQLDYLKENEWFKHAIRVAVLINNDGCVSHPEECKRVLKDFTGNDEMVKEVKDISELKDMIVLMTMNSVIKQTRSGTQQKWGDVSFVFPALDGEE